MIHSYLGYGAFKSSPFKMGGFSNEVKGFIFEKICIGTDNNIQCTKDCVSAHCFCVTEFETVFRGLIFWRFVFVLPPIGHTCMIAPNKKPTKKKCFTVYYSKCTSWIERF